MIETTPETASYWEALGAGRLTAMQCARCGCIQPTPRRLCRCGAAEMRQVELPAQARLVSYTVASYAPPDRPYLPSPYILGIVSFPDLPHRMMALIDVPDNLPKIGEMLTFHPFRHGDVALPQFARRPSGRPHEENHDD